ncbi:alanine racemase [Sesbania bispinosa]|nr:alanine racemase [Sesbania bispinosa]
MPYWTIDPVLQPQVTNWARKLSTRKTLHVSALWPHNIQDYSKPSYRAGRQKYQSVNLEISP